MKAIFVFSDEVGEYKKNMRKKAARKNKYYIRGSLFIDAFAYKELIPIIRELKTNHGFDANYEIKFSDIWNWEHGRGGDKEKAEIGRKYIESCLDKLKQINDVKYIFTVTFLDGSHYRGDEIKLLKMHILDLMQRIHFELKPKKGGSDEGFASIFLDMLNKKHCKELSAAYYQIYSGEEQDYISNYSTIKDSITFENSSFSIGIQMIDFVTGVFHGCLLGREFSKRSYKTYIQDKVRAHDNEIFGYGIIEVPTNNEYREKLRNTLYELYK